MNGTLVYPKARWLVLITAVACYVAVGCFIIMLAPIIGLISDEFGRSPGEVSFYGMGLFGIVNAISVICSGFLYDKFGIKRILAVFSIGVLVIALLLPVFTQSMNGIILFRVLLGILGGPIAACLAPLGAAWFPPQERGRAGGIVSAALPVGITMSLMIMGTQLGITHGNWRVALETLTVIPAAVVVLVIIMLIVTKNTVLPVEERDAALEGHNKKLFASILKAPMIWLTILAFVFYMLCMNAMTDLTPGYIAIDRPMGLGLGSETASFVSMLNSIGNICGAIATGFIVDKLLKGRVRPILVAAFVVQAICIFLMRASFVTDTRPLMMVVLFLIGFTITVTACSLTTFIMLRFPLGVNGRVFSFSMGAGLLMGSVGVSVCAWMLHFSDGYMLPFLFVAIIAIVALVPSFLIEKVKMAKDETLIEVSQAAEKQ